MAPLATLQQVTTAVAPLATTASMARVAKTDDLVFALQAYPNKTDLTTSLVSVAKTTDLKLIATQNQIDKAVLNLAKIDQVNELASSITRLPEIQKAVSAILELVPNIAKKDDVSVLPTVDQLKFQLTLLATSASVDEIPTRQDMNTSVDSLPKTSDLQTAVASLATMDSLKNFATKQDLSFVVSKVAKPSDLSTVTSNLASKNDIAGLSKNLDLTSVIGGLAKEDTLQTLSKKVDDVAKSTDLATITSSMAQQNTLEKVATREDLTNIASTLIKPSDLDTALQSVTIPLTDVAKSSEFESLATTKDVADIISPLAKETSMLTTNDVKNVLADLPRSSDILSLATNQRVAEVTSSLAKVPTHEQLNAAVAPLPTKADLVNLVASELTSRTAELAKASDLAKLATQADIETLRKLLESSRIAGNFTFPSVSATKSQVASLDDVLSPVISVKPFSSRIVEQTMGSDNDDLTGIGEHVSSTSAVPQVEGTNVSVIPHSGSIHTCVDPQPSDMSAPVIPGPSRARKHTMLSSPSVSGQPPAKRLTQAPPSTESSMLDDNLVDQLALGKGKIRVTEQTTSSDREDTASEPAIAAAGKEWTEIQEFEDNLQGTNLTNISGDNYVEHLILLDNFGDALKAIENILTACADDDLVQHLAIHEEAMEQARKNVLSRLTSTKANLKEYRVTLADSIRR